MNGLPDGFVVRLLDHVRVRDGGRTLIGGTPLRVSHLSKIAPKLFAGETVAVETPVSRLFAESLLESGMAEPVTGALRDFDLSEVTCVIPVRDRATELNRLLTSVRGVPNIVVADDGSARPDLIAEVCSRRGAQLVALDRNLGPAAARNAGLAAAKTPFVVFIDSDVVITVDAVRQLLKHFHDPKVGAVAPRILALESNTGWIGRYEAVRSSLDRGQQSALVKPRSAVSWIPSAVLAVRVESLQGGFDESMRVGEDVDLIWRLIDSSWRVRYDADIMARHDHRTTFRHWFRRKAFYGEGADLLAARHGQKVAPAVLSPASTGILLAALAQRRWSLPMIGVLTGVTAVRLRMNLERSGSPRLLSAELAAEGTVASLSQGMALLLRHWWPLTAVGSVFSKRVRRAVLVCAVLDAAVEYYRLSPGMTKSSFALARRLDDIAYGVGVWRGAIRGRSTRALVPDLRFSSES